jgi:hypothetical protein
MSVGSAELNDFGMPKKLVVFNYFGCADFDDAAAFRRRRRSVA